MRSHRNDPNNIFAPVRPEPVANPPRRNNTTQSATSTTNNTTSTSNSAAKATNSTTNSATRPNNAYSTVIKSTASVGTQANSTAPKPKASAAPGEVGNELRIIIIDENWSQYCYRIKMNTPFGKLITRFCAQVKRADQSSILFWYHGRLVEDEDTPKTLNVKDGEVILAHYIKKS